MSRKAMERMVAEGKKLLQRQEKREADAAKRKAREEFLNEPVRCALCLKDVPRKATVEVKGLGNACKAHPGVA